MIKLLSAHGAVEHVFPEPPADGDPYALAIVIAIALVFTVWILIRNKKMKAAPAEEPAAEEKKADDDDDGFDIIMDFFKNK